MIVLRQNLELSDDRHISSELLVDHESKDAQHSGTAVVELDATLEELGLLIERVPSEVDVTVPEVTNELSGLGTIGLVLHDEELKKTNEKKNLSSSSRGDGVRSSDGGETVGERVERVSSSVDRSREVESGTGGDLSEEGKHGNTSVLDLDVSETVELLLVGIVKESKRIVEAKRRLDTKLALEL